MMPIRQPSAKDECTRPLFTCSKSDVVLVSTLLTFKRLTHRFSFSIADVEQSNAAWA